MKNTTLSIIAASLLFSSTTVAVKADFWSESRDTTKEYVNKAMFWKSEHLENIDFEHIYPKSFYQTSYFGWTITGVAIVGAGAFSYFTAGAGAPAAATGVSSVAAWVGGGSGYMAGLSTIGSWFGGNAMVGAAILNGLSIGTISSGFGAGAKLASMTILAKAGMALSVTALGLDGIAYFKNSETGQMEYRVRIVVPKNIGSKEVRELVDNIYEAKESVQKESVQEGIALLKNKFRAYNNSSEDMLVLGVIAANEGEYDLFKHAISKIDRSKLENMGFLYYLDALNSLYQGSEKEALVYLQNSIDENKYALESIALSINLMGYNNFSKNESKIEELVKFAKENFDENTYTTPLSLVSIYYRVGTLYFTNERYVKARQYYEKAEDSLGIIQTYFGKQFKHTIELSIVNSLYKEGKVALASKKYNDILEDIDEEDTNETNKIKSEYIGNNL